MFITPAFAQSAGGLAEGGFGLLPIVFVMVIFYFLLIRPQQKRAKQHKEMLSAIRRGDKIVTSGGLTGTIVKVVEDSETVEIEIAKDQLRQEGKPEAMLENIAKGKIKRFFKDNTLLNQDYIKDGKISVSDYVKSADQDLVVTGFKRLALV